MKKVKGNFLISGILFLCFVLFTVVVATVDVQPIGPEGSSVGLAGLNGAFADLIGGPDMGWYKLTEVLGALVLAVAAGFGSLGVCQWVKRKSLKLVDPDLYVLAGFYVLVAAFYGLFEVLTINYRPVILEGGLEASYPSTHTMLAVCILTTAAMEVNRGTEKGWPRSAVSFLLGVLMGATVIGRVLSGVHWFTDILGGLLLSAALVWLYYAVISVVGKKGIKE